MRRRQVQAELAELKAWLTDEEAKDRDEIAWFDAKLEGYVQALLAAGKVRYGEKSYPLPNSQRIGYRWTETDWQITNAVALVIWAKAKGYVRTTEEIDWGERVKPRLVPLTEVVGSEAVDRESGDVVPGVILTRPAGDRLLVSEKRRQRRAGGAGEHADVRQHAGVSQDPRVGARGRS
jgi:hypothetical protein